MSLNDNKKKTRTNNKENSRNLEVQKNMSYNLKETLKKYKYKLNVPVSQFHEKQKKGNLVLNRGGSMK